MTRGHRREKMVLYVEEHVVGSEVLHGAAQSSGEQTDRFATMVNSPNGEKRGEALSGKHRDNVVLQPHKRQEQAADRDPCCDSKFGENPGESCSPRLFPRVDMEPDRKGWS